MKRKKQDKNYENLNIQVTEKLFEALYVYPII